MMKKHRAPQSELESLRAWFETDLVERFTRYAGIHTTSDHHVDTSPSSTGQWDLARVVRDDLERIGLESAQVTDKCYVYARLPSNLDHEVPTVAFIAHLDTSPDSSGKDVKVLLHKNWDGKAIRLPSGAVIDPAENPSLAPRKGQTIITSDGSTLLGADDKAGIAEILCALRFLAQHTDIAHGDIEVVFTPDEEIGRGVDHFPKDLVKAKFCYTLDGDEEGTYNAECFNGWSVSVDFQGRSIHPGYARGKMVNAAAMAASFASALPRTESPEATDETFGYYCLQEISGTIEKAHISIILRDFETSEIERRCAFLEQLARSTELAFSGGKVTVACKKQYANMRDSLVKEPKIMSALVEAIELTGMTPVGKRIRGGTDGARLTEEGIPCPNIFAGGQNFHSRTEWVPLEAMVRAAQVVVHLAGLWAES